jgi:diaminohydroxyphosphoribosylaminopyrimidine deaminase/5-amino-6-(5-phosphoribosylamino)uracil reductase
MAGVAEEVAMRRAIAISAAGIATTSPNPPVGCIILDREGAAAGEGFHVRKGEAHAEVQALSAAGGLAAGGTAVVSLEPCNHAGRTPACRQALIDAGVIRVVIALLDPTSRGEGGAARLRAAGVEVETGVLESEARVVLAPWLAAQRLRRPVTTWPYVVGERGFRAMSQEVADVRLLALGSDVIYRADGTVTEVVPGSHGAGVLRLPDISGADDPRMTVRTLYEGGVRRLLLAVGPAMAEPLLAHGLIDHVFAYLPHGNASRRPNLAEPLAIVPPGFRIVSITRLEEFVRVEADLDGQYYPNYQR